MLNENSRNKWIISNEATFLCFQNTGESKRIPSFIELTTPCRFLHIWNFQLITFKHSKNKLQMSNCHWASSKLLRKWHGQIKNCLIFMIIQQNGRKRVLRSLLVTLKRFRVWKHTFKCSSVLLMFKSSHSKLNKCRMNHSNDDNWQFSEPLYVLENKNRLWAISRVRLRHQKFSFFSTFLSIQEEFSCDCMWVCHKLAETF